MTNRWNLSPARSVFLTIALGVISVSAAIAEEFPAVIGIDNRNGYSPDRYLASADRFEMFRAEIEAEGHTLAPLTTFEAADLAGLDALILAMPDATNPAWVDYSSTEIAAIQDFVANGGGLMFHGEAGGLSNASVTNVNDLLSPFGIAFAATGQSSAGEAVPASAYAMNHPVFNGITQVIGLDFYRAIDTVGTPAIDPFMPAWSGSRFIAVVNTVLGSGNVAVIGDTSLWTDPGEGDDTDIMIYDPIGPPMPDDNLVLLHNIIRFVTALIGDVNLDGVVDLTDLGIVLGNYGMTGAALTDGDVNGDGVIDLSDIGALLAQYGNSR